MDDFKHAANVHLDAVEHGAGNNKSIVFMHKVEEGAAHMSYGLQVAQLAGIPKAVITSARKKLAQLEVNQVASSNQPQTDLFASDVNVDNDSVCEKPLSSAVIEMLESIQPDDLTPKEALNVLYSLKNLK